MTTESTLKTLLESDFAGMETFIEQVMVPMFPGDNYCEEKQDCFDSDQDLKSRAEKLGITGIIQWGYAELSSGAYLFEVILGKDSEGKEADLRRSRQSLMHFIRIWMRSNSWLSTFVVFRYEEPKNRTWRFSYIYRKDDEFSNPKRFTYLFRAGQPARTAIERFEKLFSVARNNELAVKHVKAAFAVEPMSDAFFVGTNKKNGLSKEDKNKDFVFWENQYKDEKTRNKFGYVQWYLLFTSYVIANKTNPDAFGDYFKTCDEKIIRDYVKKLFGRIVFLFFLQKKGWMGCPSDSDKWENGDQRFMQNLFIKASDAQKDDYLDGILEPLFFNCLNAQRPRDVYDTRVKGIGEVRIPYLNGGLFERDENIDPPKSKFPADYFKYLFEFFDRYNFTIDENDADDAEIGVDPEMLGRIFENLLEDNKDKGAYYTPKEIVSYMCKESLIAYLNKDNQYDAAALRHFIEKHDLDDEAAVLDNDKCKEELLNKLITVKICDPAIGSGAFPMGLLLELKKCREALGEQNPSKADIIQNNIYGVDIEAGAVDIARLRFWLSILVDADEPKPLPNLNYKIMQGNSLLESYQIHDLSSISDDIVETDATKSTRKRKNRGLFGDEGVQLDLYVDNKIFQKSDKSDTINWPVTLCNHQLQVSVNQYNSATDVALRHTLKGDILKGAFDLYEVAADEKTREQAFEFLKQSIETIDLSTATGIYYYFTEHQLRQMLKDKINILIRELLKTRANLDLKDIDPSGNADFFLWHTWFKDVFDKGGFDIVIGNPPYISSEDQKKTIQLRTQRASLNRMKDKYTTLYNKWDLFIPFMEFGLVLLKSQGILSMVVKTELTNQKYAIKMRKLLIDKNRLFEVCWGVNQFDANVRTCIVFTKKTIQREDDLKKQHLNEFVMIKHINDAHLIDSCITKRISDLIQTDDYVLGLTETVNSIKKYSNCIKLGEICCISYGLRPNSDEKTAKGEFKKRDLISSSYDKIHCRKYIEGKDISKYHVDRVRYIEYGTERAPSKFTRPTFKEWYEHPKILIQIVGSLNCTLDSDVFYIHNHSIVGCMLWKDLKNISNTSINKIISETDTVKTREEMEKLSQLIDLKYILAILNSKTCNMLISAIKGDAISIYPNDIKDIPIPIASIDERNQITSIVDKILTIKQENSNNNTLALESELDDLIERLYSSCLFDKN